MKMIPSAFVLTAEEPMHLNGEEDHEAQKHFVTHVA